MPMPIDQLKIQGTDLDRRRRLSTEDYATAKMMHAQGHSQRAIGRHFGVCHSLIGFILFPERYKGLYAARKARGDGSTRGQLTAAARSVRAYKKTLVAQGHLS